MVITDAVALRPRDVLSKAVTWLSDPSIGVCILSKKAVDIGNLPKYRGKL